MEGQLFGHKVALDLLIQLWEFCSCLGSNHRTKAVYFYKLITNCDIFDSQQVFKLSMSSNKREAGGDEEESSAKREKIDEQLLDQENKESIKEESSEENQNGSPKQTPSNGQPSETADKNDMKNDDVAENSTDDNKVNDVTVVCRCLI